jgi:8-oxo-dGTP pyrophosphatase MutT (NUDIX family)
MTVRLTSRALVRHPGDGRLLMTRRSMAESFAPGKWEIPGGHVRAGELPECTAVREVLEETGIVTSWSGQACWLRWIRNPGGDLHLALVSWCTYVTGDPRPEPGCEARWIMPGDIRKLELSVPDALPLIEMHLGSRRSRPADG